MSSWLSITSATTPQGSRIACRDSNGAAAPKAAEPRVHRGCGCFIFLAGLLKGFRAAGAPGDEGQPRTERNLSKGEAGVGAMVRQATLSHKHKSNVDIQTLLLSHDSSRKIGQSYKNLGQLGGGSFGRVFRARSIATREEAAVKRIPLSGVAMDMHFVHTELEALISLNHPNIVKFYEFFEDGRNLYVVTELCVEGNFKRLNQDIDDPTEIKLLFRDLMMAMAYCHDHGVVHRDLKFENCLIQKQPQMRRVTKVIDFGLAAIRRPGDPSERWSTGRLGSMYFIAPEVIDSRRNYGVKCDCWAVGVMLYIVLTDEHPCTETASVTPNELFARICSGPIRHDPLDWDCVDESAKDLILKLLVRNPDKRLDSQAALQHEWFRNLQEFASWKASSRSWGFSGSQPDWLNNQMVSRIRSFATYSRFERAMLTLAAHHAMSRDVDDLRAAFEQLDKTKTGSLTKVEILEGIRHCNGQEISEEDFDGIFASLDGEKTGKVQYTDWLAATLQPSLLSTEKATQQLWNFFDQDHEGKVCKRKLREMLRGNPMVCSALDSGGPNDDDGYLTEAEFKKLVGEIAGNLESRSRAAEAKSVPNVQGNGDDAFSFAFNFYDL